MDREFIESKIPHRPPMLLLDSVKSISDQQIVCLKTFGDTEFFHQGHYPGNPIIPGFILCECAAQAGAVLAASQSDLNGDPLLTRVNDVKFKQIVRPGDTIEVTTEIEQRLSRAIYFSARVTVEGRMAVSLSFAVMLSSDG